MINLFSTTISTGPIGGAPLPLIKVTPLIISCLKGPSLCEKVSCEKKKVIIKILTGISFLIACLLNENKDKKIITNFLI